MINYIFHIAIIKNAEQLLRIFVLNMIGFNASLPLLFVCHENYCQKIMELK